MYTIKEIYIPPVIRLFIASSRELNVADWIEGHCSPDACHPDCRPGPCDPDNDCSPDHKDNDSNSDNNNLIKNRINSEVINNDKPQLTSGSLLRQEEFGGLLFNKEGCKAYQLNKTAFCFISDILNFGINATLVKSSDIYDVPAEVLRNDIENTLACAAELGFLLL
jgi:hypothetical protein